MRRTTISVLAAAVAVFGIVAVASAQCADALQDGLEANVAVAQVGDTIEYTVTLWIAPTGNPCTLYHTTVYFHPPPDVQNAPCVDYLSAVQLNPTPITVSPGTLITWTSADYPILSQPVTETWAGGRAWAYTCTRYVPDVAGANPPMPPPTSPLWSRDSAQTNVDVPCPEPCIEITKEVDCDKSKVGDTVTYSICIENCGEYFDLTDIEVYDDLLAAQHGSPLPGFPSTLTPGEDVCFEFEYEIQPGDDTGAYYPNATLVNQAYVMATDVCSGEPLDAEYSDEVTVYLIHPDIEVEKVCLTPMVPAGGYAQFEITITNTGDCALNATADEPIPGQLRDHNIEDASLYKTEVDRPDIGGPDMRSGVSFGRVFISPGETIQWTVSRPDPGGVDCIYNSITVTWTLPPEYCELPNTGEAFAEACCEISPPCIEVTKEVDCDVSKAGDEVVYTVCVSNPCATDLFNLTVVDDVMGDLSFLFPPGLAVDQTLCVEVPYTIQVDDPDPLVNTVTATAENEAGVSVTAYASAEVDLIHPSVSVTKECLTPQVPAGGNAQFEVVITNTGDCSVVITTTEPEIAGPFAMAAGDVHTAMVVRADPGGVDCVYNDITVTWTLPPEYCELPNTGTEYAEACCEIEQQGCMVIIDEEGMDNDFLTVEQAAAALGVEPDYLINDDRPTEIGNPVLRWNELGVGDIVLLPTGEVDDEGWYALPEEDVLPWTIADYIDGVVPQDQLDKIPDVMPLRNHELIALIGQTCVAVVYDSDISMNYDPINANLQGARYGLFYFTVLGYEVPGHLPEAQSSTSLVSLWLRVEEPHDPPSEAYHVQVRDHEPDAIEINRARCQNGVLSVWGESDFAPGAFMTVSVDGPDDGSDLAVSPLVVEETMAYNGSYYEFELDGGLTGNLSGRRVTISTDKGGAYNSYIEGNCGGANKSSDEQHGSDKTQQLSDDLGILPAKAWSQTVPNPFRGSTTISFGIPRSGAVAIDVFDVTGRHVSSLLSTEKSAGSHEVVWNGRTSDNTPVPAGVYFYRFSFDNEIQMKKMIVMK